MAKNILLTCSRGSIVVEIRLSNLRLGVWVWLQPLNATNFSRMKQSKH